MKPHLRSVKFGFWLSIRLAECSNYGRKRKLEIDFTIHGSVFITTFQQNNTENAVQTDIKKYIHSVVGLTKFLRNLNSEII